MNRFERGVLIVGGASGIGLSCVERLLTCGCPKIYVVDRNAPAIKDSRIEYIPCNLAGDDIRFMESIRDIDTLIITAGIGRLAPFSTMTPEEIDVTFQINAVSILKILLHFHALMQGQAPFRTAVMVSIAGLVSSPLYAVYSATKAALHRGIEAINIELEKSGSDNRILEVSPGIIQGTAFHGEATDLVRLAPLADAILDRMSTRETRFIPKYEEVYKDVLARYSSDAHDFGLQSYDHKMANGCLEYKSKLKIGYLSGTFDLFHIGHLNILRQAKQMCDYLVVGVHSCALHKGKQAFISLEERKAIVGSIRHVDRVVDAPLEDVDAHALYNYNLLFVGSDYKGTERFKRYEKLFAGTGVEIIYFPYTDGTSSTHLRDALKKL
jgi:glycerol-3-phosphate cytidylyltransferase